jgi:carbohydrate-selective porin OprB
MTTRTIAAALAAAALAVPAAAVADPGHGKGHDKPAKKSKTVTYVFKGTFTAPGTVAVTSGNAHVRKGGYVGQSISFDLSSAKVVGVDTNADLKVDASDVADGDKVLVQARIAKGTKFAAPTEGESAAAIAARKLVDKTGAPAAD